MSRFFEPPLPPIRRDRSDDRFDDYPVDYPSEPEVPWLKTLVNATPHVVSIYLDGPFSATPSIIDVRPSGILARATEIREPDALFDFTLATGGEPVAQVVVNRVVYGELSGLPEPTAGTYYIVSRVAAEAGKAAGRDDLLVVDQTVRDDQGRIIGCRALARV